MWPRELHDEAGQILTALILGLGMLEREQSLSSEAAEQVLELKHMTGTVMESLHRLARNLRPASLDKLGLVAAMHQLIDTFRQQNSIEVRFAAPGLDLPGAGPGQPWHNEASVANGTRRRLSPEVETTLYRVVQEALTNVARHAQASRVDIVIELRAASLRNLGDGRRIAPGRTASSDGSPGSTSVVAIIEDNGLGFDMEAVHTIRAAWAVGHRANEPRCWAAP